jgi:Arc/MetJ family transcription regulator
MYTPGRIAAMPMHIDLDESLVNEVMQLGAYATKKAAVNAALAEYVRMLKRRRLLELRGQVPWEGSLDRMRERRAK